MCLKTRDRAKSHRSSGNLIEISQIAGLDDPHPPGLPPTTPAPDRHTEDAQLLSSLDAACGRRSQAQTVIDAAILRHPHAVITTGTDRWGPANPSPDGS